MRNATLQRISDVSGEMTLKEIPKMDINTCLGIAVESGWRVKSERKGPEA